MTFSCAWWKESNRPYTCAPGRPNIVLTPCATSPLTIASPPVMEVIVSSPVVADLAGNGGVLSVRDGHVSNKQRLAHLLPRKWRTLFEPGARRRRAPQRLPPRILK